MSGECDDCGSHPLECICNMSRPPIPINWDKVDELLMCGCPGTEIAAFFGMHEDTFYRRVEDRYTMGFSEYSAKKKSTGEALLRLQQHQKALGLTKKGDNTLLIFLGKQRLGQRENPNDKVVPEEVLKSFDALMRQIDKAQEERANKRPATTETTSPDRSLQAVSESEQPIKESIFT